MLRITTLWFSESISPLSETDDEVHNMSMHNAWGIVKSFKLHSTKSVPINLSLSKWNLQILLLNINASVICACQVDAIRHLESSYCYNNNYGFLFLDINRPMNQLAVSTNWIPCLDNYQSQQIQRHLEKKNLIPVLLIT